MTSVNDKNILSMSNVPVSKAEERRLLILQNSVNAVAICTAKVEKPIDLQDVKATPKNMQY